VKGAAVLMRFTDEHRQRSSRVVNPGKLGRDSEEDSRAGSETDSRAGSEEDSRAGSETDSRAGLRIAPETNVLWAFSSGALGEVALPVAA